MLIIKQPPKSKLALNMDMS